LALVLPKIAVLTGSSAAPGDHFILEGHRWSKVPGLGNHRADRTNAD
jgi:hypothetical protein